MKEPAHRAFNSCSARVSGSEIISGAHSAGMRSVRVGSSTLAATLRTIWFSVPLQRSSDCALPHDSTREKAGFQQCNTMKARIRLGNPIKQKALTTASDWLLEEHKLKQEPGQNWLKSVNNEGSSV